MLKVAVDTKVRSEGEDATSRLARCLLLEVRPTRAHESSRTSLLAYVLKEEAETYGYSCSERDQAYKAGFNVAVSTARHSLILFHSVKVGELKDGDVRKTLLEY